MTMPALLDGRLTIPAIASPMFIISQLELVIAQCRAGVVGSFPSLNARPSGVFEDWLVRLNAELTPQDAPFAVNLIVHRSNARLEEDLALCVKYEVPIVITSLGARPDVNEAIHSYGGIVLHDIINDMFARKAIEKGADGLIAVATGAGGHAGTLSPFALVQEIREWFDGPLALSGAIATGGAIAAARVMGADLAYIGSAFIATEEAHAVDAYKQMIVDSKGEDIVYSNLFTGVHGNYLKPSIVAAGMDPDHLPEADPSKMDFGAAVSGGAKAWRDIWGCGQGIGAVHAVLPAAKLVERLTQEYRTALARLMG
ncbi:nitronate monooxygenase [Sphingomonas sp. CGMCC 1.13654]|uniref:Nitronate monooxygenase n=1 Tax=Sphingomonas chungangi TaxID=2683589 RepID=A0A838L4P6_9SPHN|nr:nitronate monooxygenase family protein [Sphingomonas chungangi]MBA2932618.1 nitronate monooxygenase [Sphingomonas chungangi]MVW56241.1 nitronate monooxygenase [Sphingomonas chungangi]